MEKITRKEFELLGSSDSYNNDGATKQARAKAMAKFTKNINDSLVTLAQSAERSSLALEKIAFAMAYKDPPTFHNNEYAESQRRQEWGERFRKKFPE